MTEDNKNLPSINDFTDSGEDLPSVKEFMVEESLPSVEDYIETEEEEIEEETTEEPAETAEDLTEVLRLISDVRRDIPDIPEIKYYDKELEQLAEQISQVRNEIPEVPEVRYYEKEVEAICEQIDLVRSEIKDLPEVKYYDEQVDAIEDRIDNLQTEVANLHEVKYYDDEIVAICEAIDKIRAEIPTFPKWVNEVNEVPDFSWIGKTFSVIDDDFIKINDVVENLKTRFSTDFDTLAERFETTDFNTNVNINSKAEKINQRIDEEKKKIWKELSDASLKIWEHHKTFKDDDRKLKKQILGEYNKLKNSLNKSIKESTEQNVKTDELLLKYFSELKEEITGLPEVKYYDEDISNVKGEIKALQKIVEEIKSSQKGFNEELKQLNEVALEEPHDVPQSVGGPQDPLTPIDQKFATFKDLKQHYQIFINRIQSQLSAVGGGGAGRIPDLDDVEFDAGIGTGKLLIFNGAKWVGIASTALGGGGGGGGIGTEGSINTTGIITAAALDTDFITGIAATFSGNVTVGGTITYQDVRHIDAVGIITAQQGIQVLANGLDITGVGTFVGTSGTTIIGGVGNTALYVDGNARVVGIFTVGRASITIDGDNDIISIGNTVTITDSYINIGAGVSISAFASGINSAPNVLYVAKDGTDTNNGTSIDNAFLTIGGAVGAATSGYTIKVLSGNYQESNPIEVPAFVSIVGDDQRSVKVSGTITHKDIFSVRKGVKLANMTFQNHVAPAAAVGFPTGEIAENVGGGRWKGPYIQNCTSSTTTGTGIRIDGNQARLLKAMNVDAFTQYNEGGVGVAVTNGGFAQLVSLFTICCNEAVTCDKGGQADIANSNCSFGTYGLVARGVNDLQYSGIVTSSASAAQDNIVLNITNTNPSYNISGVDYTHQTGVATVTTSAAHNFQVGMGVTLADIVFSCSYGSKTYPYRRPYVFEVDSIPATTKFVTNLGISTVAHTYSSGGTARIETDRPYDGQVCYFDTLYNTVETIAVGSGGTGYTSTPVVTVATPGGPNGETATAYATVENESIASITIISNGSQYESTPTVTIGGPNVGINTATATASMAPIYYTINSSTPVTAGITTLTLDENLINTVGVGSTAYFFEVSKIIASSHTFEYVGAGDLIANATPKRGGVTVQANEVVTESGGKVLYTSTDQSGNFRIGDDLQINQNTGTISGKSFSKSLFSEMTPFILALS